MNLFKHKKNQLLIPVKDNEEEEDEESEQNCQSFDFSKPPFVSETSSNTKATGETENGLFPLYNISIFGG